MGLIPMNIQPSKWKDLPAKDGCDYVRGPGGTIKTRTISGWEYYAKLKANRMSKRDGFLWVPHVMYVDHGNYYRISLGYQKDEHNK